MICINGIKLKLYNHQITALKRSTGSAMHGFAKYRLTAPQNKLVKNRGKLCKIFKFWSFLQSKSVNNVCTVL